MKNILKYIFKINFRKLSFILEEGPKFEILYSEISYHALSKEKGYVMIQLNLNNDITVHNFEITKCDQLFLFTSEKIEGKFLFYKKLIRLYVLFF